MPTPALGDITSDQFRALASINRELGVDVRATNRQNFVFRDLTEEQLPVPVPAARRDRHGRSGRRAGPRRRELPRRRHLQPGRHPEPGPGRRPSARPSRRPAWPRSAGVRINISGCTNSLRPAPHRRHRLPGRRAAGPRQAAPGYQMLLGGHVGETEIEFGDKALRLPAKRDGRGRRRVVGRFANERDAGETLRRVAGPLRRAPRRSPRTSRTSTTCPRPTRPPSSTSTTTSRARTWPRSAKASARRRDRETVWLTGLPSAGKTTIARAVEKRLLDEGRTVEVLDGDVVRTHLTKGLGFSREDRDENVRRIGFVADLLSRNGVIVLCSVISPYRNIRDAAAGDARRPVRRGLRVHARRGVQRAGREGPLRQAAGGRDHRPHRRRRPLRAAARRPRSTIPTHELSVDEAVERVLASASVTTAATRFSEEELAEISASVRVRAAGARSSGGRSTRSATPSASPRRSRTRCSSTSPSG